MMRDHSIGFVQTEVVCAVIVLVARGLDEVKGRQVSGE